MRGLHALAWCEWCGLGDAKDSSQHRHSNSAQKTLGDQYGMRMPEWAAWCVVFSGSWSELGVCKKCCKLSKFLPMPVLILLFHNRMWAYLWAYHCRCPRVDRRECIG